jgi:hypothetical protein
MSILECQKFLESSQKTCLGFKNENKLESSKNLELAQKASTEFSLQSIGCHSHTRVHLNLRMVILEIGNVLFGFHGGFCTRANAG